MKSISVENFSALAKGLGTRKGYYGGFSPSETAYSLILFGSACLVPIVLVFLAFFYPIKSSIQPALIEAIRFAKAGKFRMMGATCMLIVYVHAFASFFIFSIGALMVVLRMDPLIILWQLAWMFIKAFDIVPFILAWPISLISAYFIFGKLLLDNTRKEEGRKVALAALLGIFAGTSVWWLSVADALHNIDPGYFWRVIDGTYLTCRLGCDSSVGGSFLTTVSLFFLSLFFMLLGAISHVILLKVLQKLSVIK